MLSAPFNQTPNQGLRFNLSDSPMNDFTMNIGYHDNFIPKPKMYNQFFNPNPYLSNLGQDGKMYSISEVDSLLSSNVNFNNEYNLSQTDHNTNNKDFDLGLLSSRLQSMSVKSNSLSRSNSAHNSPFDNRVNLRHFSQSTSNTPLPHHSRLNSRDLDMMRGNPPIMQLFNNGNFNAPTSSPHQSITATNNSNSSYIINRQSPVELIEYQSMASKMGFLVGQDLEEVLNRSATMKNSNTSRISNFFKHKHGSTGGSHLTQKQYLVLGVRVPSKEHVSEIVGKEGKKIKMIRQTTGALIATPNEKEDHVFLIEAVPDTAIKVGQIIQQLAEQITRNKLGNIVGLMGERPRSPPVLGNRTPLATATIGVPQRLVGKVIGTQGSIITTVQKETGTEIKSPPKDELRAPGDTADFEISVYENGTVNSEETAWLQIHRAKQLIAHLVMRVWDQQPRNSTPSSDEGGNCFTSVICSPEWIWPEVSRMDDVDAKEIIDRILRSSKAKITPSNSSTESANVIVDGLIMPPSASASGPGMSPPFSISLLNDKKSSISGFNSVHNSTTPYKLLGPCDDNANINWNQRNNIVVNDCFQSSMENQSRPINGGGFKNPSNFYPSSHHHFPSNVTMSQISDSNSMAHRPTGLGSQQYFSTNHNDSAFYDSYYPSVVYSPPPPPSNRECGSGNHLYMSGDSCCYTIEHHHQHSEILGHNLVASVSSSSSSHSPSSSPSCAAVSASICAGTISCESSWSKPPVFYSSSTSSANNSNYLDETRFGNVKYLWKNSSDFPSSTHVPSHACHGSVQSVINADSNLSQSWINKIDIDHHQSQQQQLQSTILRHSHRSIVKPESLFGTIGDGRKRNSAASNSDDREDL